jgi:protein-disulfide isomerase
MAFLGSESVDAAVMARYAASKGLFWEMHDLLYASQSGENQGAFSRDKLVAMAVRIGLPEAGARAALDDPALISAVQADLNEGERLGITSTPTLIFTGGRRFSGVPDAATLQAAITEALGLASPTPSVAP